MFRLLSNGPILQGNHQVRFCTLYSVSGSVGVYIPTQGRSFSFEKCVVLGVVDMHLLCSMLATPSDSYCT